MFIFVTSVLIVIVVSALCSLTEAALYAVRLPFVRQLVELGRPAGLRLAEFKNNMERPITAILIINTIANTAGAAVAGSQARVLFGEGAVLWFSAIFTLAVLFLSEIIPKVMGVTYSRKLAPMMSLPLQTSMNLLRPVVWGSQRLAQLAKPGEPAMLAPEDEVRQFAELSAEEGSILPFEAELVRNVLRLNDIKAREIMTPRTVVRKAPAEDTVQTIRGQTAEWPSRIPVYHSNDPENWFGVVLRDDILTALARDQFGVTLRELAKPLGYVPETTPCHKLLHEFLSRREHLLAVVDEYGGIVGVVTLEDVMEALIGREIVDETDSEVDLQAMARRRGTAEPPRAPGTGETP